MNKAWVHAEAVGEQVSTTTLELLTKARDLATTVEAVFVGEASDALTQTLQAHGCSKVLQTGDVDGAMVGPAGAAAIAHAVSAGTSPDIILMATSYDGRDLGARLSVKLDKSILTNVVDVELFDGAAVGIEPVFGGTTNVKTKLTGEGPYLVLLRPKSFDPTTVEGVTAAVETLEMPELGNAGAARVLSSHIEESDGPKLDEASVVVAGGRGLGEAEKFAMIEQLAKRLGGAPAASRAIVDSGWVPYSYQVGQTGKVVKPNLYIAAGISGATQHVVGMKGAKTVIAINKDADAPIFKVADLGIVGDVHKVLPALLQALEAS